MAKKKFKLKKRFKKLILGIILLLIVVFLGYKGVETLKYHNTYEYKLLKVGYDKETVKVIQNKLDKKLIDRLTNEEKIDYLLGIIKEKYFIEENFDTYLKYYEENSGKTYSDVIAIVNVGATKDWYTDSKETKDKGILTLVNKFNILPEKYDAGTIKTFSATYAYGKVSGAEEAYNAFIEMANAARKENVVLVLTSGYRSHADQEKIYNDYKNTRGEEYADGIAARPGSSEHETGLALDIFTLNATMDMFHTTEAYAWLSEHAEKYGFILRYPEGKEYLTGYKPESWHYRYVGVETAKKVKEAGITYDEYYAFYLAR